MRREFRRNKNSSSCALAAQRAARHARLFPSPALHVLEPRLLLSATDPTTAEQQSLFLLNRMRADPAAELALLLNSGDAQLNNALTYFDVDLTLLQQQWSSLTPVAPLAWNNTLGSIALTHNNLMIQYSTQSHQLPGEPKLGQRALDAGYDYAWIGENVYAYAYSAFYAHAGFAIDWGNAPTDIGGIQSPPGHRNTMMSAEFREVGIAIKLDLDSTNTVGPYVVTQDFGRTLGTQTPWLVGTIYKDNDNDDYYDLNEAVTNVTITAKNSATGAEFSTTARTAGGYQLQLPAGTYTLTYSGTSLAADYQTLLTVGTANILRDLDTTDIDPLPPPPPPPVNDAPTGAFDDLTRSSLGSFDLGPRTLTGYAFDVQAGESPVQVRILLDGNLLTETTANLPRTDLSVGSTDHGFSVSLPWLSAGEHTLTLIAIDNPSNAEITLATTTVSVDSTPFGFVDVLSSGLISGWAFDPAATSPTTIRVTVDGVEFATTSASIARPDLLPLLGTSNHAFSLQLTDVPSGTRTVEVWALDDSSTSHTLLASATLTYNKLPIGYLDVTNSTVIAGWAQDPDSPDQPVTVRIDLNGISWQTLTADTFRPDLLAVGNGNYAFKVDTTSLEPGEYAVDVYALDAQTSEARLLASQTLTVDVAAAPERPPIGYLDALSGTRLVGWSADLDAPSTPVTLRVDVDGVTVYTGLSQAERPDLLAVLPDAFHGFSFEIPELATGTHTVEVFALNLADSAPTLFATRTVSDALPIGYVDFASTQQLVGWALHPALGASPVTLLLEIDDVLVSTTPADLYRADLEPLFGSAYHGFTIQLPTLASGAHRVALKVQNPFNGIAVTLLDMPMLFA